MKTKFYIRFHQPSDDKKFSIQFDVDIKIGFQFAIIMFSHFAPVNYLLEAEPSPQFSRHYAILGQPTVDLSEFRSKRAFSNVNGALHLFNAIKTIFLYSFDYGPYAVFVTTKIVEH